MRRDPAAALLAATVLLFTLPMSSAASPSYPPATLVGPTDLDVVPQLLPLKAQTCYRETDGDGTYDAGEPVYLDAIEAVCAVNVKEGDVRLTPFGSYAAGSQVKPTDADFGKPLETDIIGAAYNYRDSVADGVWGLGDALYLDMDADALVDLGDLRLTAAGSKAPGTTVALLDPDLGANLTAGTLKDEHLYYWDLDSDGAYGVGDAVFLDSDKDGLAERGDVLLTAHPQPGYGSAMSAIRFFPVPALKAVAAQFCFIDEDADAAYDLGETAILDLVEGNCGKGADATDLRLTAGGAAGDLPAFTFITTADDDFNDKVYNFTKPRLRHHDRDLPLAAVNGRDALYLDVQDDGAITVADIRLTAHEGEPAGEWVRPSDNDGGLPLRATIFENTDVAFWDVNGDGVPGAGDPVYLDRDNDGLVEPNDLRLTAVLATVLDGIAPEDTTPPPTEDSGTDEGQGGDDSTDGDQTGDADDGTGTPAAPDAPAKKGSPLPVALALLAAVAAAFAVPRRRT